MNSFQGVVKLEPSVMSGEDRYRSRSPDGRDYGGSPYRSRSASRSHSRSHSPRSRSYSHSPPPRGKGYSRSPSRSPPPRRGRRRSYSRSYSRSRSRSHSRSRHHRRYSRSRSRSYSPYGRKKYGRGRNRSRSPMSNRRRHQGNRFNPSPCRVVGVFGLSLYTGEKEIREMFSKYGPIEQVQVVYDHQTGRSRGFAFIYYEDIDDAIDAKERCNGLELDGRKIRVDYSITKRAHTPTPGVYMGKPTRSSHEERGGGGRYDDHDDYHDRGRSSRSSRY